MSRSLALSPPVTTVNQGIPATFIGSISFGALFVIKDVVGVIQVGSVLSDLNGFIQTEMTIIAQNVGVGTPGGIGSYRLQIAGPYEVFFDQPLISTPPPTITTGWDLFVDTSGNIASITGIEAQLQDVACACRLFLGELWYDTTQGIPYLNEILGRTPPPLSFVSAQLKKAGLTVPGVVDIQSELTLTNRQLTGSILVTNDQGQTGTVAVSGPLPWYVTPISPNTPN